MNRPHHDFMPIANERDVQAALEYVSAQAVPLARTVLGRELPVDTLCLFAKSLDEYALIERAILARGIRSPVSHDPTLYVDTSLSIGDHAITLLGVRKPDESRPWVGYADYPVDTVAFAALAEEVTDNAHAQKILSGRREPLIGLTHPDYDTAGYIHIPGWRPERG